jgi:hypothetical protein
MEYIPRIAVRLPVIAGGNPAIRPPIIRRWWPVRGRP